MNRGCYIVGFWDRVEAVISKTGLSKKQARQYYGQNVEAQRKALEDERLEFEVEKEEFFDSLSLLETAECRDRLRLAFIYKQTVERPADPYARAFYNQSIGAILAGGPLPNIKKNKE